MLLFSERIKLQSIEESEKLTLSKWVAKSNQKDKFCTEIQEYLANPKDRKKPSLFSKSLQVKERLL